MARPPANGSNPPEDLLACCPEAQADGVPCTSLGLACAECERATTPRDSAPDGERPPPPDR